MVMERRLVATALLAYLTFATYHLVFQATHLRHFPPADAVGRRACWRWGSPSRWCC
jgi:hypothetical protein